MLVSWWIGLWWLKYWIARWCKSLTAEPEVGSLIPHLPPWQGLDWMIHRDPSSSEVLRLLYAIIDCTAFWLVYVFVVSLPLLHSNGNNGITCSQLYLVRAVNNSQNLSLDSFLLNHSFEYNMAALSSWVEFTIEKFIFSGMKQITWLSSTGLLTVVFGDCLRKTAMLTASSNFNHTFQNEKSEMHTLVTRGVHGWFHQPSYMGWFYWSIGTQLRRNPHIVLLCVRVRLCVHVWSGVPTSETNTWMLHMVTVSQ